MLPSNRNFEFNMILGRFYFLGLFRHVRSGHVRTQFWNKFPKEIQANPRRSLCERCEQCLPQVLEMKGPEDPEILVFYNSRQFGWLLKVSNVPWIQDHISILLLSVSKDFGVHLSPYALEMP